MTIDASLTESPFSPKGVPTYEIEADGKEDERLKEETEKAAKAELCTKAIATNR